MSGPPFLPRFRAVLAVATGRGLAPRISLFAAALAFHALLALAPILLIMLAVAGRLLGEEEARRSLAEALVRFAGRGSEELATTMLGMVAPSGRLSTGTLLGVALLLYFASSLFSQVRAALDAVWEVPTKSLGHALLARILAFAETLLAIAAALVVLALGVVRSIVWPILKQSGAAAETAWILWTRLGTLWMTFVVLAVAFHYLPSLRPRPSWGAVVAGALPATLLLNLASEVIGLIVAHSALASLYGAAGSVIAFLLWVYYSAWVFLFGAEVCRAWEESSPEARRVGLAR
jgi:membrane protein